MPERRRSLSGAAADQAKDAEIARLRQEVADLKGERDAFGTRCETNCKLWSDLAEALGKPRTPRDIDGMIAEIAELKGQLATEHATAVHATGCVDRGCRICNAAMARYIAEADATQGGKDGE